MKKSFLDDVIWESFSESFFVFIFRLFNLNVISLDVFATPVKRHQHQRTASMFLRETFHLSMKKLFIAEGKDFSKTIFPFDT